MRNPDKRPAKKEEPAPADGFKNPNKLDLKPTRLMKRKQKAAAALDSTIKSAMPSFAKTKKIKVRKLFSLQEADEVISALEGTCLNEIQ